MIPTSTFKLNTVLLVLPKNCCSLTEQLLNQSDTQFHIARWTKLHANFALEEVATTHCSHIFNIHILGKTVPIPTFN